jgi:hypothetical protein
MSENADSRGPGADHPMILVPERSLGLETQSRMMNNPQFKREFEAAQAETRHTLGLPVL